MVMNWQTIKGVFRQRATAALATLATLGTLSLVVSLALLATSTAHASPRIEVVAQGLDNPWSLAFLPNGDMLVTERPGRLRRVDAKSGKLSPPITGLPDIAAGGQGGLLDVVLHPNFKTNQRVFFSYSGASDDGSTTTVAEGKLVGNRLENVKQHFAVQPVIDNYYHFGSRLVFTHDGALIATTGERYSYSQEAQNPNNTLGSIVRIWPDDDSKKPEIIAIGIRNSQGIAKRFVNGKEQLWFIDHGPKGGDELNILKIGATPTNYGWPAITYGRNYDGSVVSDKTHADGMEQPVIHWTPSIAPCGISVYTGDIYPKWRGNIFVGALAKQHLRRVVLKGDKVVDQEQLFKGWGRFRDVRQGPDGYLYVLMPYSRKFRDADGFVGRVLPGEP